MNLLKYLIESSGLNQAQFAKKVGRNPQHINRQIKSGGKMSFDSLIEVCRNSRNRGLEI